ncbi:MAG: V0D/AC39 family V-type ATPase subunit [Huintestinicola sp.]|uniref:V0D/AC39 family V-type ATPase subunit n=1 Tax=Huintestinicola sp. TaxID=2981661 RepID=UPI003F123451
MNGKKGSGRRNLNATMAKMHAVYGKRLRQEDYYALLSCTSVSDAAGYLKRNTYFSRALEGVDTENIHRGNLENILRRSLMENYFRMIGFEKIGGDEFYNYITVKTEIDEILICILHLNAGTSDHITTLPIYMNKYTSFNLMELARVGSYGELLSLTEKTPYYDILKEHRPEEDGGHIDYPAIELKLRTYYSKRIIESLKKFGGETEKRLRTYIGTQTDMINIINSYRMKRYFNADADEIKARMIPIYMRIPEKKMDELYSAKDDKEFLERFSKTYYGREIAEKGFDMRNPEMSLVQFRFLQTKRAFSRSTSAPECFYTFIQLAEIEVRNIIRIIEGIRYSLPTKEIAELIIT